MKVFIFFSFLFFGLNAYAQNSGTRYDTCQYLGQYAGQWIYKNGSDTIRMTFRINRDYNPSFNSLSDNLYGWIEYKRGNTIIESTYPYKNMALPFNSSTQQADNISVQLRLYTCEPTNLVLRGGITDFHQSKEIHQVTATVNSTKTQMTWKQEFSEWHGAFTGAVGMTLPREFVLVKQ